MEIDFFDYLEKDYRHLSYDIKEFNKTIFSSPHSSIIKGRIISEKIIQEVSSLEGFGSLDMISQVDRLRKLKVEGVLQYDIFELFQEIRLIGNRAAHDNIEGELSSALTIHKNIYKIIYWFIEVYINYKFESPIYKSPLPNENKRIDIDEKVMSDLIKDMINKQISNKENYMLDEIKDKAITQDSKPRDIKIDKEDSFNMKCLAQELSKLRESSKEAVEGLAQFTEFKRYMHIEREAQIKLQDLIFKAKDSNKAQLIFVSGSVGDGKSHIISYFNRKYPDIMDSFILHNDATESLEPEMTSMDTLNEVLDEFSDNKIEESNKKLILAINLGTLNNFIDSEYGERFSILKKYVHDKKIIETSIEYTSFDENSFFQFVNFSDYHIFTLKDGKVYSQYIEELIDKITNSSELNIFYSSYKNNCIECKNCNCCPIKANYELLSNKKVKGSIIDLLVQAVIKNKIIISTRALINFIYELIIPISYIDVNSVTFKNNIPKLNNLEYIRSLMPNLLFNHKELSFIFNSLSSLDPLDVRNEGVDNFIIKFNNSTDYLIFFEKYIDFPKTYMNKLDRTNILETEDENIKYELLKLFIRSYYVCGKEDLFSLNDNIYEHYMKSLYLLNKGETQNLKTLYDNVKQGILKWNGKADKDQINIFLGQNQVKYKISEDIDLKPDISNLIQTQERELKKFSSTLKLSYKTEKSDECYDIDIDFALYKLLMQINNGYRPNKKDKNQFISFIEFINKLEETGSQDEKLIFTEKNRENNKQYRLEYDDQFKVYRFMENAI